MAVHPPQTAGVTVADSDWQPSNPPLASLAALAQAVAAAPDLRSVYRALYTFTKVVSPTSGIFVSLYDPERRQRTCVYGAGDDGEDDVATLPPMPMTDSPQSRAIATGEPVLTGDLQTALAGQPNVMLGFDADPRLAQSSLAVPMTILGRSIGVFEVQSVVPSAYTEEHVVAMQLAANLAALAIERASAAEPTSPHDRALRAEIGTIIAGRAFTPVFQPIVELDSRAIVGYEALTRFTDGTPPHVRFGQADVLGLGLELEAATLAAAFRASEALPANLWLNVNVSPALVLTGEPLGTILRQWGNHAVLELTEHVVVDDYEALRHAIRRLGETIRLAIDDAGSGFASFRHVLELSPHFVKLDLAIVRGIDADPARQAFVAGMRHFAVTTGCGLIAEGIETESELQALRTLGVPLGQGYLLGRPGPL